MKHAFLIIAHEDFRVLEVLLSMLDDMRNDVYLHVDRRAKGLYDRVSGWRMENAGFFLLQDRMEVYWGDLSQVQTEYLLFERAYRNGGYSYYHLLSGVDLPLKSQDEIHEFFNRHQGTEFVGFCQGESHERDVRRKVGRYHFFTKWKRDKVVLRRHFFSFLRNAALNLQKPLGYPRPFEREFRKGWNWVSITHPFCGFLLEHKQEMSARLRHTLCADEIFLQTLLWNSRFRKNLYCADNPEKGSLRKIDWKRGSPHVWTESDWDELVLSEAMFARKFSSSDGTLIYRIRDYCGKGR